jgi:ornithine carbamoyltransferase
MSGRTSATKRPPATASSARATATDGARHYLSVLDLQPHEIERVLQLAAALKQQRARRQRGDRPLEGRHVALLFSKPSLRTRTTFTIAVRELGGDVVELPADAGLGGRESVEDVAKNLDRWLAGCVVRTYAQAGLQRFAAAATRMHVINALTDEEHPCQALADMFTMAERFGDLAGRTLAFVGDGNNVATSLAHACALLGVHLRIATPAGYELPAHVVDTFRKFAHHGARLETTLDPVVAVRHADAVYTDAWTSMGQEAETAEREQVFRSYQVNGRLMASASTQAIFMHCLPAHRGEEVTDEVMDSAASVIFDQAENRLHTQKALLTVLMA